MDKYDQILAELRSIKKLLTILSQDKIDAFNKTIATKYFSTPERKKMYELFDGTKSYKEIGALVKVSPEAVRQFAVSLEEAGLVEIISNSKTRYPKRNF